MKPKALVYAQDLETQRLFQEFLEVQDISVVSVSENLTPINYFFAIVQTEKDLEIIEPYLELDAKKVIALPYGLPKPKATAKYVYFYELLTPRVDYKAGYANWILSSLKTKAHVYLPKDD